MKLQLAILLLISNTYLLQAQTNNLPSEMVSQFRFRYPHAGNVQWKKSNKGYEVVFVLNNSNMSADFSPEGEWRQTCRQISFAALPSDIQKDFSVSKFKTWKITIVQEVQSMSEPLQYNISVTKSGLLKKHLLFQVNEGLVNVR